jgi:SOS response regulatory protein OraA/RecX
MDSEIHSMLLKKAGALLARRAYCRFEMRKKLSSLAEEPKVESVLDHLERLKLLNDEEYAYNFAFCRIRQRGWSPAKVRSALLQNHVERASIEFALQQVRNEIDEASVIRVQAQRYCGTRGLPTDMKGIRKLIMHLHHRGFDEENIYRALKDIIPAEALQRFQTGE